MSSKEQFVIDNKGNRTGVLLDVKYYEELLTAMEELEAIRTYDEAKTSGDEYIPFNQAIEEINPRGQF